MDLAKNLKIDSVSRLQPPAALKLSPSSTVRQAVALMQEERTGCVVVCQGEQLVGIFTERDLIKRVLGAGKPLSLPLKDCMTSRPVVVHTKDPVGVALRKMQEGGYRHLPVVDEAGHAVGMLSVKRIVRYLVEHFPTTVYNQHPDPDAVQHDREGA
jgi:CBS domain-containing protein